MLQAVFESSCPRTVTSRASTALATRHANLSRLVRSLNLLDTALAPRGPELRTDQSSSQVFGALASQQGNIRAPSATSRAR